MLIEVVIQVMIVKENHKITSTSEDIKMMLICLLYLK